MKLIQDLRRLIVWSLIILIFDLLFLKLIIIMKTFFNHILKETNKLQVK